MAARRILVIEDDATFANALGELIRRCGHEPESAARGDIGLVLARDRRPDAIVLDLRLPGIDGWVLLDRLKHGAATSNIPVCVLTGDSRRLRAMRLGAFAFLQKPVANDAFAAVLRDVDEFLARPDRRVLVIDDDAARRGEIVAAIGGEGIQVTAVSTAGEIDGGIVRSFDCCVIGTDASRVEPVSIAPIARLLPPRGATVLARVDGESDADRIPDLQRNAHEAIVKPWQRFEDLAAQIATALHRPSAVPSKRGVSRVPFDPALAGKRVLVIDDDARNVLALTGLAERCRMEVRAARSGAEALDLLRTSPRRVDLVLSDIMMPEMDGLATIRAIRELPDYRRTPIVAVTAKALKGDRETCLQAGASDFVAKPVDAEQLYSVMRVLLAD